ncbi:ATP-binding protein [Actinokineospora guangxiensis]|uniref:ATP-binding protein n=1 Tax=Actinokineospora guangxiensis TaxID=1490288 RepID=A0ABW0EPI4_9PSEU
MKAATGDNRDAAGQGVRTAVIRLRPRPGSAASARYFTSTVLSSWRIAEQVMEDVLLAVSELVTNAIEHGVGEVLLEVFDLAGRCLRVQVTDHGVGANPALIPFTPDSARSRGLAIVAAVSASWGHEAREDGLRVWAEFPMVRINPI